MEFYRRRQSTVVVRHAGGDRVVAVLEVTSPGNKPSRHALQSFLEKVAELLDRRIHLLILDLHPPTARDPRGIHGVIWENISGQEYVAETGKPLTLAETLKRLSDFAGFNVLPFWNQLARRKEGPDVMTELGKCGLEFVTDRDGLTIREVESR